MSTAVAVLMASVAAVVVAPAGAALAAAVPGFAAVFQSDGLALSGVGVDGVGHPTGLAMASGSSPAVAALTTGGTVTAFANSSGHLEWVGPDGTDHLTGSFVAAGTSPSVAAQPGGGFLIAFQDSSHLLHTLDSDGKLATVYSGHVEAATSPSIAGLPGGDTAIAFEATEGFSATVHLKAPNGVTNFNTTNPDAHGWPAVTAYPDGRAFFAYRRIGGTVEIVGTDSSVGVLTQAAAAGTSPAITALSGGGLAVAFQGSDGFLYLAGRDHISRNLSQAMATGTSPAITALPGGGTAIAFQGSNGELQQAITDSTGHTTTHTTGLPMGTHTSPAVPAIPPITAPTLTTVQTGGTTVQPDGTSVTAITVTWTDNSTTETSFTINRAPRNEYPHRVGQVTSTTSAGTGTSYTYTDTIPAGTRPCYTITATNTTGATSPPTNPACTDPPNPLPTGLGITTSLDTAGFTGIENSNAIGSDGLGITAYMGDSALRIAHCEDTECTTVTAHTLDPAGVVQAKVPSLSIGSDGLPIISYAKYRVLANGHINWDLKVAHCVDVVCSSATLTVLDNTAMVADNTGLTIASDGLATILYADSTFPASVKVAHCVNVACTSVTTATVDTGGGGDETGGGVPALAIATTPTGVTYLAYSHSPGLKVATCGNLSCSVLATQTMVDSSPGTGDMASIAIGPDNLPLLSYPTGMGHSDLKVAHCLNAACSASTQTVLTNTGGYTGWYNSLAVGSDGLAIISYYDLTNRNLVASHCNNPDCTSATTTNLDEFGDVGDHTAITIGNDGLPLISYEDNTNIDLKVAHCGDVACAQPLQAPFIIKPPQTPTAQRKPAANRRSPR